MEAKTMTKHYSQRCHKGEFQHVSISSTVITTM